MAAYNAHVHALLDSLIVDEKLFKEWEIIFMVVGGLGIEHAPFVTSLSTRFDLTMNLFDLQALLMDQEMEIVVSMESLILVNTTAAPEVAAIKSGSTEV